MFGLSKEEKIIAALNLEPASRFSVRFFCPEKLTDMSLDIYFPRGALELNVNDCRVFVSPSCLSITTNGKDRLNTWSNISRKDLSKIKGEFILKDYKKIGIILAQKNDLMIVKKGKEFKWHPNREGTMESFILQGKIKPHKKN